jgi:signal transduction histidine kinase
MQTFPLLLPSVRWLLAVLLAAGGVASDLAWAQSGQKQVLVLYSTRRDAQIVVVGDRVLPRILDTGLSGNLDYYSEFIDQARFSRTDYQSAFRDFLRLKYSAQKFDLVVAMGDISLAFVAKFRDDLFGGVPVVFFASEPSPPAVANATGVIAELNLSGTLDLAIALQPEIQHVFVVSGTEGSNITYEDTARAQFSRYASRLDFTYLSGLPTGDLEAKLAALPPRSIVYYLVVDRDAADENFNPLGYLTRIVAVGNAPTYSWVDSTMGRGIVGGSLKSQEAQAEAVARLALRVLRGEQAGSIPATTADLNVRQVDWRQLRRWRISEARLPPGTLVRFRELSLWQRYRMYVLGTATLLLAQTALIVGLILQARRRRRAEEQLLASQAQLRASYDRIRDLGGRLLNAQEAERAHIARELHDDVSQQMALLSIDLQLLSGLGPERRSDAARLAREALERAEGITTSVHDLSHRLHPAKLRLIGLESALSSLQRELSQPGVTIRFSHDGVPAAIPHDTTLCMYRVVQEAVQNALKHGAACAVSIDLRGVPGGLALTIVDDGVGFDVEAVRGKGLGLISMGERLEALHGKLEVSSRPGAGTRIDVTVPLDVAQATDAVAV